MTTINRIPQKNKVKQGDYQVSGSPLLVVNEQPSGQNLDGFKPWYDLKYQGCLFYYINDRQEGFELTVFIPWPDLASQGHLFIYN